MSDLDATRYRPLPGAVDFTFMYAGHDAFRRDLNRLTRAADAGRATDPATLAGWATFKNQLHIHHSIEDTALWPPLRAKVTNRPDHTAVLDAMEAEHAQIDPLLARVDTALAAGRRPGLAEAVIELTEVLGAHMTHEEQQALPLVESYLGAKGWDAFRDAIRQRQGLRGAAEFLPWLLDGAPEELSKRVLRELPAPARLIYRTAWLPAYRRGSRWADAAS